MHPSLGRMTTYSIDIHHPFNLQVILVIVSGLKNRSRHKSVNKTYFPSKPSFTSIMMMDIDRDINIDKFGKNNKCYEKDNIQMEEEKCKLDLEV